MIQYWFFIVIALVIFYVSLSQPKIWTDFSFSTLSVGVLSFLFIMLVLSVNMWDPKVVTYEPTAHLSYEV
jgi:hypothetical protein